MSMEMWKFGRNMSKCKLTKNSFNDAKKVKESLLNYPKYNHLFFSFYTEYIKNIIMMTRSICFLTIQKIGAMMK